MKALTFCCFLILIAFPVASKADIITIEGVVKSVDVKKRTITVETGSKERTLDVSGKVNISIDENDESLESLTNGQKVSLGYHDQLEVVVKIEAKSDEFKASGATDFSLFNGINFSGWRYDRGTSSVEREDAWAIGPNRLLICQGVAGHAFLLTDEKYRDFTLTLEWRIPEGVKPTKDGLGILVRAKGIHTPDQQSIAFQLNGSPKGAVWVVGQSQPFIAVVGTPNKDFRNRLILSDSKLSVPLGEWNTLKVICDGGEVVILQNDKKTIHLKDVDSVAGQIGLMSQGTMMELRNLNLSTR